MYGYVDDIPIQDEVEPTLDSITEEQHEEAEKGKIKCTSVGALKHLQKLPGLSKKHKMKNTPQSSEVEMGNAGGDPVGESPPGDSHTTVSAV